MCLTHGRQSRRRNSRLMSRSISRLPHKKMGYHRYWWHPSFSLDSIPFDGRSQITSKGIKNPNPLPIWKTWFGLFWCGSPGRARTYNPSVNSRMLCHWATEEYRIRQRPILPGRLQPSTFGTQGLNFCVRDGNRWNPFVIATGNRIKLSCFATKQCYHIFRMLSSNYCTLTTAHRMIFFQPFQLISSSSTTSIKPSTN